MFIFSYLCGGINFTDMANLKLSHIINNRLVYIRQKTKKRISVPLQQEAIMIIVLTNLAINTSLIGLISYFEI